jgi:hypothetical protein
MRELLQHLLKLAPDQDPYRRNHLRRFEILDHLCIHAACGLALIADDFKPDPGAVHSQDIGGRVLQSERSESVEGAPGAITHGFEFSLGTE